MRPCASLGFAATRCSSSATYASVSPGGAKPPTSRVAAAEGLAWGTVPSARFPPSTPPKRAAAAATQTAASTTEVFFLIESSPVRKGPAAQGRPLPLVVLRTALGGRGNRLVAGERRRDVGEVGAEHSIVRVDSVAEEVVRAPVRQPEQPVQEGTVALGERTQVDVDDVVFEPAAV